MLAGEDAEASRLGLKQLLANAPTPLESRILSRGVVSLPSSPQRSRRGVVLTTQESEGLLVPSRNGEAFVLPSRCLPQNGTRCADRGPRL